MMNRETKREFQALLRAINEGLWSLLALGAMIGASYIFFLMMYNAHH